MEPGGSMLHSEGLSNNPYPSRINPIPVYNNNNNNNNNKLRTMCKVGILDPVRTTQYKIESEKLFSSYTL